MDISLNGERVILITGCYANGRTAVRAFTSLGTPFAIVTVNIPNEHLDEDEVIVKDYAENKGMLEQLIRQGVFHPSHRIIEGTHVNFQVCRLKADL